MSTDVKSPQEQNWQNFCDYHANCDWSGTWTRYSPDQEVIESFQCIRSFHVSEDGSEINHQNHYTYPDGKKETKTFGPYKKPNTISLFLDNSFSWGSTKVEIGKPFGFETGFRHEDRRISVVVMYDDSGMERIVVISEKLGNFAEQFTSPEKDFSGNWEGTSKTMTPDWLVSSSVATSVNQLENLGEDYLTLRFPDGISITSPRKVAPGKEFLAAVDWLVNENLLLRGIRKFDASGFTGLTLQVFTQKHR